jgi:RHS repeat-associated protein
VAIDENGQALGRYRYDPMGRRVYKETATETTWFVYADEGLVAELRADGTLKRAYGWKPQGLWGTDPLWLADRGLSGEWTAHVYHNDHLWTPQRLTASDGAVSWSGRSEAFGLTVAVVGSVENPLRFPGQYWDGESSMHYNWNRFYAVAHARFAERDPEWFYAVIFEKDWPAFTSEYEYSDSSPLRRTDNEGMMSITLDRKSCRNLSEGDRARMTAAAQGAANNASKSPTCSRSPRDMKIKCGACGGNCGRVAVPGAGRICVNINLVNSGNCGVGPGCLESTIMHEAIHGCGQRGEVEPYACEVRFYSETCRLVVPPQYRPKCENEKPCG